MYKTCISSAVRVTLSVSADSGELRKLIDIELKYYSKSEMKLLVEKYR